MEPSDAEQNSDPTDIPVLYRIARPRRRNERPKTLSARIWRTVLPRRADEGLGLILSFREFEEIRLPLPGVVERIGENDLALSLHGPDQAVGIAIVDVQLLAGLIEVQTTGVVTSTPLEDRVPTQTDAAMVGHVLDNWLRTFDRAIGKAETEVPLTGFKTGKHLENQRAATLALDEGGFFVLSMGLDLSEGARQARLDLVFPIENLNGNTVVKQQKYEPPASVWTAQAEINVIALRRTISLSELERLKEGDEIPLDPDAINNMRLETQNGSFLVRARLGQLNGMRAVRIGAFGANPVPLDNLGDGQPEQAEPLLPSTGATPSVPTIEGQATAIDTPQDPNPSSKEAGKADMLPSAPSES